jgi:hypothetical protein
MLLVGYALPDGSCMWSADPGARHPPSLFVMMNPRSSIRPNVTSVTLLVKGGPCRDTSEREGKVAA